MSSQAKTQPGRRLNLQFEQLEDRSVLSGCTMAAGVIHTNSNITNNVAAQVGSSTAGQNSAPAAQTETVLTASLSSPNGTGAIGSVVYESEQHHGTTFTELAVVVRGATAGDKLDVTIVDPGAAAGTNPTVLGTVTVDANGNGRLFLHTGPNSANPLPTNVAAGFLVNVGPAGSVSGAFAGPAAPTGTVTETHLTTSLADPNITATTGNVEYVSVQGNGQPYTELKVTVKGPGAVNGAIVAIDGVKVGALTTDSNGVGHLSLSTNLFDLWATPLPANFPTAIKVGSVVTIGGTADSSGNVTGGTVTGSLAAPAPHFGHHHRQH